MKTNGTNTTETTALQKRILLQYENLRDFVESTGISYAKLEGKEEFTLEDILLIRKTFNLDADEIKAYFFPDYKPAEEKTTMISLIVLESIIRGLEHIESGLNALDMLAKGNILEIGSTIANEDFQAAFGFIMEQVTEQVTDLRAKLTGKYFSTRNQIGKAG